MACYKDSFTLHTHIYSIYEELFNVEKKSFYVYVSLCAPY